jgi:hypothetical protein
VPAALAGVPVLGIFALHQRARRRRGRDPLVETSIWRKREFCSGVAFVMLFFGAMTGSSSRSPCSCSSVAERGHQQEPATVGVARSQGSAADREPAGQPAPGDSPRSAGSLAALRASARVVSWDR